jgi:predicted nucleic acid-binding protein
MSFVLDASVALAWMLGEPESDLVVRAGSAAHSEHIHVPASWPLEMVNGLLMAARSGRIDQDELASCLAAVSVLPVAIATADVAVACSAIALLGQQHGLTAYDAAYLELAIRLGLPLATQHADLLRAAAAAGAELI